MSLSPPNCKTQGDEPRKEGRDSQGMPGLLVESIPLLGALQRSREMEYHTLPSLLLLWEIPPRENMGSPELLPGPSPEGNHHMVPPQPGAVLAAGKSYSSSHIHW